MRRCKIEDFDTPHPYILAYDGYLLGDNAHEWHVWHWLRYPFGKWLPKNSMDVRVTELS